MRLSLHTDFALRTLMFLAVTDGHRSITEIAKAYGISKNHLMKVAQRLVAEGFVEAARGRTGGLRLARPSSDINVGVVVRRMEDTGTFVECFDPVTNTCVITPNCQLRHALYGALEAFSRHLDQFSIADMIADPAAMRASLQ
jgi:Rrf2 family nitric oxide-sensitive transcriptional repressor